MRSIFVLSSILSISMNCLSQSYMPLQFSAPLVNNPALTGLTNNREMNLRFSNSTFVNNLYVDYNQYSNKLHGGIGIYFNTKQVNSLNTNFNNVGISYAYQNKINNNWQYSLGASLEFSNKNKDYQANKFNYNFGGLIYSKKMFLGFTARDLNTAHSTLNFTFGYEYQPFKNKEFYITPYIQTTFSNYDFMFTAANLNFTYKKFSLGGGIKNSRGYINAAYQFNNFKISYSYGGTIDAYYPETSHSISVKFKLKNKKATPSSLRFTPKLF